MNNTNCRQDSRDLCCLSIGIFGCLFLFLLFAYPFFVPHVQVYVCLSKCLFLCVFIVFLMLVYDYFMNQTFKYCVSTVQLVSLTFSQFKMF